MKAAWWRWLAGGALAVAAAVLLPLVYRRECAEREEQRLLELRRTQQPLPRQLAAVERLQALGKTHTTTGLDLDELRVQLTAQLVQSSANVRRADHWLGQPLSAEEALQVQLQRGLDLFLLDRLDE